ncbi:MAG: NUDIX hydrolase [Bacteroidota bacterium]
MSHPVSANNLIDMITKEIITAALSRRQRKVISSEEYPLYKRAAVLITLVPIDDEFSILLTVRTDEVETHKGQISCPGGMRDDGDNDLTQTALRETEEELGIPRTSIEILGVSDDQATPTKFIITPVVGCLDELPSLTLNTNEVAEVFTVPLSVFIEKKNARNEEREFQGKIHTVWYFQYGKHMIWGATAILLVNFAEIIMKANTSGQ